MSRSLKDPVEPAPSSALPSASQRNPFPRDPQDFDADPRISFSRLDNRYILEEADTGAEWEWDGAGSRWIPSYDEALLEQQQQAYGVADADEAGPSTNNKKRKQGDDGQKQAKKAKPERKNTAVYVTSLPLDVDVKEVKRIFSRCGVISEEIDSGQPRIKLYSNEDGSFKGDALVVYFRPESVPLAIQMLDDSDFRFGEPGPAGKMRVKEADYSYKKTKENQEEAKTGPAGAAAGDQPAHARKGGISKEQKKIIKKTEKMNAKLADWSDDEDPQSLAQTSSRFDKVVVLKHMFTLAELDADAAAILDIKEDIRDECSKLGEVTNVVLFDKEERGIVTVRFSDSQAARACVRLMDGRSFDGRQVEATISDGKEQFKKSKEGGAAATVAEDDDDSEDDDEDESRRMDQFGNWLEAAENGNGETSTNGHKQANKKASKSS